MIMIIIYFVSFLSLLLLEEEEAYMVRCVLRGEGARGGWSCRRLFTRFPWGLPCIHTYLVSVSMHYVGRYLSRDSGTEHNGTPASCVYRLSPRFKEGQIHPNNKGRRSNTRRKGLGLAWYPKRMESCAPTSEKKQDDGSSTTKDAKSRAEQIIEAFLP
jgi:hypothetical protein